MLFYRGLHGITRDDASAMLTYGMKSAGLENFGSQLREKHKAKTGLDIERDSIAKLLESHRNAAPIIEGKSGSYLMSLTDDRNISIIKNSEWIFRIVIPRDRIAESEEQINERTVVVRDKDYETTGEKEYTTITPFLHPNFIHSLEDGKTGKILYINNEFGQVD